MTRCKALRIIGRVIIASAVSVLFFTSGAAVIDQNSKVLDIMVPMRDGIKLHTVVYLPEDGKRFPVVLLRTPYSLKDTNTKPNKNYLEKNIIHIIQDCRGTGQSEGVFYPLFPEINDGDDCLKWITEQSWFNGRIAMEGGSSTGATQWYAALSSNSALVGITPDVAPSNCHESVTYIGGAYCLDFSMQWGLGSHYRYGDYPKMDFNWEKLAWHLPLDDIDRESGLGKVDFWHDWLDHPGYDNYWKEIDLNRHYHQIKTPAYISGGWYDQYSRGTLENFSGMQAYAGSGKARKYTRCIIGPWTHSGALVEGMGLGENAMRSDINKIRDRFRENILKNPEVDPVPDEPALKYFMMGLNEWRKSATWPIKGIRKTEYYFHSVRGANTRFGDGSLNKEIPITEPPDTFIYDPNNPVPTNGGCVLTLPGGVFDQRKIEERSDILVFSTGLLAENVEVAGNVRLTLFASGNTPDTDFTVRLIDVYPDGRALNICDGIIRARYRKSMTKPELIKENQIYEYDIDCWDTANCFMKGHQIRIEVSSSNFPRFDRNPNTGHKIGIDDELRIAKQTIYHDKKHSSRLILPVLVK